MKNESKGLDGSIEVDRYKRSVRVPRLLKRVCPGLFFISKLLYVKK